MRSLLTSKALLLGVVTTQALAQTTATIPAYVRNYAPFVYLDIHEVYFPSDIQAQLQNSYPASQDFSAITNGPSNLGLDNLAQLDAIPGNCSHSNFDGCDVYLTSKANVSTYPSWLYGVPPSRNYSTTGATSAAIITYDHGDGTVDAYYMYFYAFNYGNVVLNQVLGNHIGDWEHTMLRFVNGLPTSMWFSIHDYGECYTYDAVSKYGGRPIAYSALGSHGNHPTPGTYTRNIGGLNVDDTMSAGALWDPTQNAFYYSYNPSSSPTGQPAGSDTSIIANGGAFTPASADTPTSWLYFLGRWGDQQYPDTDSRQVNFLGLNKTYEWVTGPTGPWDKQLVRADVCPSAASSICVTTSTLPAISRKSTTAIISVPTSFPGLVTNVLGAGTTGSATAVSVTPGTAIPPSPTGVSSGTLQATGTTSGAGDALKSYKIKELVGIWVISAFLCSLH